MTDVMSRLAVLRRLLADDPQALAEIAELEQSFVVVVPVDVAAAATAASATTSARPAKCGGADRVLKALYAVRDKHLNMLQMPTGETGAHQAAFLAGPTWDLRKRVSAHLERCTVAIWIEAHPELIARYGGAAAASGAASAMSQIFDELTGEMRDEFLDTTLQKPFFMDRGPPVFRDDPAATAPVPVRTFRHCLEMLDRRSPSMFAFPKRARRHRPAAAAPKKRQRGGRRGEPVDNVDDNSDGSGGSEDDDEHRRHHDGYDPLTQSGKVPRSLQPQPQ